MTEFTPSLGLAKPDFNISTWHDEVNGNFDIIDSIMFAFTGITGIVGPWDNDTAYVIGNRVIDLATSRLYECNVPHTSAVTGTFAQDRTANPTYWTLVSVGIPDPYAVPGALVVGTTASVGTDLTVGDDVTINGDLNVLGNASIAGTFSGTFTGTYSGINLDEIGVIKEFGGTVAPPRTLFCYGQAISRSTYHLLFAVISTNFGAGDGVTTFNLPDYRGRVGIGKDNMGGTSANRITTAGCGIDGDVLAAVGGFETHTLITAEVPSHDHDISHTHTYSGDTGTVSADHAHYTSGSTGGISLNHTHVQNYAFGGRPAVFIGSGAINTDTQGATAISTGFVSSDHTHAWGNWSGGISVNHTHAYSGTTSAASVSTTASVGGDGPHKNVQPSLIVNKIIYTGVL